jgi:hypothetical protein
MAMTEHGPEFPLTISYHSDGNAWTFESADELLSTLDWFDSDDPAERASVMDARGRLVRLKLQHGQLLVFELAAGWPEIG